MKSLVLFFISVLVLAATGLLLEVRNSFKVPKGMEQVLKAEPVKVSVLEMDQAQKLFRDIASSPQIPFRYLADGCYARATAVGEMAEAQGVTMGRIYAEGLLVMQTQYPQYPVARWRWHVSSMVYVKDRNGKPVMMVVDPSMFKEPVTVDVWKEKMLFQGDPMKPKIDRVYFGNRYQYFPESEEPYKNDWGNSKEHAKEDNNFYLRYQLEEVTPTAPPVQPSKFQSVQPQGAVQ